MKSRKLIYILSLIGLVLVNSLYISYQFMIILIVVIAVGVFSFIMQRVSVERSRLFVKFNKNRAVCGEKVKVDMILDNRFILRVPWAKADMVIRVSDGEHTEKSVLISKYNRRRKVSKAEVFIDTNHCGVVYLHMKQLEIRDYIHMFSTRLRFDYLRKIYIFPEVIKANVLDNGEYEEYASSTIISHIRESDEIVELRDYREGDAMNRIHWNLSTAHDEYIVKQYGEELDTRSYICADLSLYDRESFRDDLDRIYQWVYSIAVRVIEKGGTAVIIGWDDSVSGVYEGEASELEVLDECMENLMDIKCSKDALSKLNNVMEWSDIELEKQPIIVTSNDYDSDIYQMLSIKKDDLAEILSHI